MTHPLGAEAISRALASVPLVSELELQFNGIAKHGLGWNTPGGRLHNLRGEDARKLLRFRELLYCGLWPEGFWTVGTFPVETASRSVARRILLEEALPRLAQWLSKDRAETWFEPQRVIQFGVDLEGERLGVLETHNDHVESVEVVVCQT